MSIKKKKELLTLDRFPVSFYPNHDLNYSSIMYSSIIIGKAVLIYTIKEKENPIKHKRQRTDVIF